MLAVNNELIRSLSRRVAQSTAIHKAIRPNLKSRPKLKAMVNVDTYKDIIYLLTNKAKANNEDEDEDARTMSSRLAKFLALPLMEVYYHGTLNDMSIEEFLDSLQLSLDDDDLLARIRPIMRSLECADSKTFHKLLTSLSKKYESYREESFDNRRHRLESQVLDLFPNYASYALWDALYNSTANLIDAYEDLDIDFEVCTDTLMAALYEYLLLQKYGKLKFGHSPIFYNILKRHLPLS